MKNKYIICTLQVASFNDLKIANIGEWRGHLNGAFSLNIEDLNQIKKNFTIDIAIDLDHETIHKGTSVAYGWIKELYIKEEELWAKVEYLEEAIELIKSKKYKYISPVFIKDTIHQISAENIGWSLHSVALTNQPFMEDLGEIILNQKQTKEKENMDEELKKELETLKNEVKTLTVELEQKKEELNTLKEEQVTSDVDSAIALNKVHSNQKESLIALGKSNPSEFKKFLASAVAINLPEKNVFINNKGDTKIDVLKLGGF